MNVWLMVGVIAYQAIISLLSLWNIKRSQNEKVTEKMRFTQYRMIILWNWIPVLALALYVLLTPLYAYEIGFRKISFNMYTLWLNGLTLCVCLLIAVSLVYQVAHYFISEDYRKKNALELEERRVNGWLYGRIQSTLIVPRTMQEKEFFFFACLSKAICEEVLWRGFLVFVLREVYPVSPLLLVGAAACLIYALLHFHEGFVGILSAGVRAALLTLVYVASDSLILGILLHFAMDFSAAFLVRDEWEEREEQIKYELWKRQQEQGDQPQAGEAPQAQPDPDDQTAQPGQGSPA